MVVTGIQLHTFFVVKVAAVIGQVIDPVRLTVDVEARGVVASTELPYANSPDFPAHDPDLTGLPYDHFWMLGMSRAVDMSKPTQENVAA